MHGKFFYTKQKIKFLYKLYLNFNKLYKSLSEIYNLFKSSKLEKEKNLTLTNN